MEFFDYRRVNMDTSVVVDKSRGERLTVRMNVTFPRVPCYRKSWFALVRFPWPPIITSRDTRPH